VARLAFLGALFLSGLAVAQTQQFTPVPVYMVPASSNDDARSAFAEVPRMVRENPVPEVFFNEGATYRSLQISTSSTEAYNRIMNAINSSMRSHTAAKLLINKKTRTVVDADGAPTSSGGTSVYDEGTADDLIASPTVQPGAQKGGAAPASGGAPAAGTKGSGGSGTSANQ
jgi:hypothetical protein